MKLKNVIMLTLLERSNEQIQASARFCIIPWVFFPHFSFSHFQLVNADITFCDSFCSLLLYSQSFGFD